MAARDLRYEWFREVAQKNRYDYIVTAHQQNDQAETFFINLLRGTGLDGLTGMQVLEGNLFRPLLSFQKEEIKSYAQQNKWSWREDSSNAQNDYIRNRIRNLVFPELEKISPAFIEMLAGTMDKLHETGLIYKQHIDLKKEKYLVKNDFGYEIELKSLLKEPVPQLLLFEILRPFYFHYNTCRTIINDHQSDSGKKFFSSSHRLVNHRGTLLITRITPEDLVIYEIPEGVELPDTPVPLKVNMISGPAVPENNPDIAMLDAARIKFPLLVRKWHKGDAFVPLGMKGRKKLSDYFIDQKFSLVQKENVWLVCSEDQVIWIVGHRIDDRFKVHENSKHILRLELLR
jgi:tRNA(Ile)-lysidine synthase